MVAKALANEVSTLNKPIHFFHRKGADCLSQWLGQSEANIRELFKKVYILKKYYILRIYINMTCAKLRIYLRNIIV